jgi:16S rRNA (cytosine1402-N4)-methyltransferase
MHPHNQNNNETHVPVLLDGVLQYLSPEAGESYLDLTAGYGGHAGAILAATGAADRALLVDRDSNAIKVLTSAFPSATVLHQDFLAASEKLVSENKQFDIILADLGVSSPHLNDGSRGFSFLVDAELDMRMDQTQDVSAETVVNEWPESELVRILRDYGEEPKAARIANLIVTHRPIHSTTQLAELAKRAWPGHSRVHPATRTFQAVRIAVNDELAMLEKTLPLWQQLLAPGGRLGVISFHSLEDRIVKRFMSHAAGERYDAELRSLTKRPVTAEPTEIVLNPRSRSAKLRVAVKIKNQKERSLSHANSG